MAVIGILYSALSIFGIVFGFVLLERPENFTDRLSSADSRREVAEDAAAGGPWDEGRQLPDDQSAGQLLPVDQSAGQQLPGDQSDGNLGGGGEIADINPPDMSSSINSLLLPETKPGHDRAVTAMLITSIQARDEGLKGPDRGATVPASFLEQDLQNNDDISDLNLLAGQEETAGADSEPSETLSKITEDTTSLATLSEKTRHYYQLISYLQNEGVEAMIAFLLKLVCSILLIAGARTARAWFLVPWMVEELVEMVGSLLQLMVSAARNGLWSLGALAMLAVLYVASGYFLYSVASYHRLLLRMSKQSQEVISSVSQGGFQQGLSYQRLEDDCWQSTLSVEFKDRAREPGFVREAKVNVDDNDEHVLYVQ